MPPLRYVAPLLSPLFLGAAVASGPDPSRDAAAPVIGGRGNWTFQYMPDRLVLPPGSCSSDGCNCHGLVVDRNSNIYLTYEPDRAGPDGDVHCMVRYGPDGAGVGVPYGSPELCSGTPHGLTLAEEEGKEYLYHANNDAAVHKTELDGTIVWTNNRRPPAYAGGMPYRPTWAAAPPGSPYAYVADGYGSQYVHAMNRSDGRFAGTATHGGRGSDPGEFSTCHGMNVDPRTGRAGGRGRRLRSSSYDDDDGRRPLVIVSDRENHRHQYFQHDPSSPDSFEYHSEFEVPGLERVCHFRAAPDGSGHAVVPALEGPVGIVDGENRLVSTIDVAGLIGDLGHLHPHDAIILPSGDMVVATWNPGRVSYWKRVTAVVDSPVMSSA